MSINYKLIGVWVLRLLAAIIMLQTLFFKFTASDESVYIFSTIGIEPWGRIGSGIVELIASVLILFPKTTWLGALLGAGVMSGAIFFHLTRLGLVVKDDGGQLFIYALLVFFSCASLLIIYRNNLLQFAKKTFR
jgi:uncharacterized membrane protein YphA (DoxX/SURF4 family)